MASIQTAFGTTELLEGILMFLPLPSLLRVQAVSRQWNQVIKNSSPLQQNLFLQPIKHEKVWLVDITNLPAQQRPLRRDYQSFARIRCAVSPKSEALRLHHGLVVLPVSFNPLIPCDGITTLPNLDAYAFHGTPLSFVLFEQFKGQTAENMFLTQPPVKHLTLEITTLTPDLEGPTRDSDETICTVKVSKENGVRLKDIISAIEAGIAAENMYYTRHSIFMHGVMVVSEDDERVVETRTKQLQTSQSSVEDACKRMEL